MDTNHGMLSAIWGAAGVIIGWAVMAFQIGRRTQEIEGKAAQASEDARAALHGLKEVAQAMATRDDLNRTITRFEDSISRMHQDLKSGITDSSRRIDELYKALPKRNGDC